MNFETILNAYDETHNRLRLHREMGANKWANHYAASRKRCRARLIKMYQDAVQENERECRPRLIKAVELAEEWKARAEAAERERDELLNCLFALIDDECRDGVSMKPQYPAQDVACQILLKAHRLALSEDGRYVLRLKDRV
jgi:hypothetical protein